MNNNNNINNQNLINRSFHRSFKAVKSQSYRRSHLQKSDTQILLEVPKSYELVQIIIRADNVEQRIASNREEY